MLIHPTAIVSKNAELGADVVVGPFAVIGDGVRIGAGTRVGPHCVIEGNTTIGANCEIFTGAVVGSRPQDLKYKGEKIYLDIGDHNIVREYCTMNPGTQEGGGRTVIGSHNLFMAYAHIAHDCRVGDHCVFANNGTLAGHVTVEDRVVIGGLAAVHQFVTVGTMAIVGGCSKAVQDVPPYSTCDGHPARVFGLNLIGLRRYKVTPESIRKLKHAYQIIFHSGLITRHAAEEVTRQVQGSDEVLHLVEFIKQSKRGLSRSCRSDTKE